MKDEQLIGRLATGIGMGTSFTQLPWAKEQFVERVGVDPFPGTINVIIDDPESMPVWVRLKQTDGIRMENPNDGPHDCDAKCWRVSINSKIDGAIVFPVVPDYPNAQVEVIAPVGVRDALGIEDGDAVTLTIRD
ncbi:MAG: CTP-dependent riboflavin kinase [Rhodospirillaceae bacterium TMED63]|nr:MAG: CTP-dependent riboflavin kinase [Rhodospirillaceae bacterium TMED63]